MKVEHVVHRLGNSDVLRSMSRCLTRYKLVMVGTACDRAFRSGRPAQRVREAGRLPSATEQDASRGHFHFGYGQRRQRGAYTRGQSGRYVLSRQWQRLSGGTCQSLPIPLWRLAEGL